MAKANPEDAKVAGWLAKLILVRSLDHIDEESAQLREGLKSELFELARIYPGDAFLQEALQAFGSEE